VTLTDEQLAAFESRGSRGHHRAQAEAEHAQNRRLHLDHRRSTDHSGDGLARDRERAQAIGADVVGTTPLSTWARVVADDKRALAVSPSGDLQDDIESYPGFDRDADREAEDADNRASSVPVAQYRPAPTLPSGWPHRPA